MVGVGKRGLEVVANAPPAFADLAYWLGRLWQGLVTAEGKEVLWWSLKAKVFGCFIHSRLVLLFLKEDFHRRKKQDKLCYLVV